MTHRHTGSFAWPQTSYSASAIPRPSVSMDHRHLHPEPQLQAIRKVARKAFDLELDGDVAKAAPHFAKLAELRKKAKGDGYGDEAEEIVRRAIVYRESRERAADEHVIRIVKLVDGLSEAVDSDLFEALFNELLVLREWRPVLAGLMGVDRTNYHLFEKNCSCDKQKPRRSRRLREMFNDPGRRAEMRRRLRIHELAGKTKVCPRTLTSVTMESHRNRTMLVTLRAIVETATPRRIQDREIGPDLARSILRVAESLSEAPKREFLSQSIGVVVNITNALIAEGCAPNQIPSYVAVLAEKMYDDNGEKDDGTHDYWSTPGGPVVSGGPGTYGGPQAAAMSPPSEPEDLPDTSHAAQPDSDQSGDMRGEPAEPDHEEPDADDFGGEPDGDEDDEFHDDNEYAPGADDDDEEYDDDEEPSESLSSEESAVLERALREAETTVSQTPGLSEDTFNNAVVEGFFSGVGRLTQKVGHAIRSRVARAATSYLKRQGYQVSSPKTQASRVAKAYGKMATAGRRYDRAATSTARKMHAASHRHPAHRRRNHEAVVQIGNAIVEFSPDSPRYAKAILVSSISEGMTQPEYLTMLSTLPRLFGKEGTCFSEGVVLPICAYECAMAQMVVAESANAPHYVTAAARTFLAESEEVEMGEITEADGKHGGTGVGWQPKTGMPCSCRPGVQRDNCRHCEGTGQVIDHAAIRNKKPSFTPRPETGRPGYYESALDERFGRTFKSGAPNKEKYGAAWGDESEKHFNPKKVATVKTHGGAEYEMSALPANRMSRIRRAASLKARAQESFCAECGNAVMESANFCTRCGTQVRESGEFIPASDPGAIGKPPANVAGDGDPQDDLGSDSVDSGEEVRSGAPGAGLPKPKQPGKVGAAGTPVDDLAPGESVQETVLTVPGDKIRQFLELGESIGLPSTAKIEAAGAAYRVTVPSTLVRELKPVLS